ncbi:alpha/beta hydrolase [Aquibacillus rhizosphaerae]|uniref:Alpha/beta hydrolase n=1 Tax=Aquibacillus rhizosphaerae TaxID=3051431 RepID=A0ABT7L9Y5_9BACI|nr:alpha/beta hydrolase [Aquibacillus sp. LR5S19]MDL4842682.1 alpha/beta hydrolase [Aquibacillus sp. LR5S19]
MTTNLEIKNVLERLSNNQQLLDFKIPTDKNDDIKKYLHYYGLNMNHIDLHIGKVGVNNVNITAQIFRPQKSKGTVFLLHGYLSHVGLLKHIIQYFTDLDLTVFTYDLQGHGLSMGKTASVKDFSDYATILEKLLHTAGKEMSHPLYVVGHSTGAAIVIDYILRHPNHSFNKVIFAAPLVRSNYWHVSKLGVYMAKMFPFITEIKRNFRKNSSDQSYLHFVNNEDPLQADFIPMEWLKALIKWNKTIQVYNKTNTPTCILQGNKDKTVDWKYNVQFIQRKFNNLQVIQIDNGRHELFNETEQIRQIAFTRINKFIAE